MNKMLFLVVIVITIFSIDSRAEDIHNINHGSDVFKRLSMKFPRHFSIVNSNRELVFIKEDSPVGSYLISIFSEKNRHGWINWADRNPVTDIPTGQCIFYEVLDLNPPQKGIEILLNKRFEDENSSSEEFWATLVFEMCNAKQAEKFVKLLDSFKDKSINRREFSEEMLKTEYVSAVNAQKFQREIWIPFCKMNHLEVRKQNWFFSDNTTFEQWKTNLSATKEGNKYLETYSRKLRRIARD